MKAGTHAVPAKPFLVWIILLIVVRMILENRFNLI